MLIGSSIGWIWMWFTRYLVIVVHTLPDGVSTACIPWYVPPTPVGLEWWRVSGQKGVHTVLFTSFIISYAT